MAVFEKKGWFRLTIPEGWEVAEGEDPVAICRPDGVGALQVTAQAQRPLRPGERLDPFMMLRAYLRGIGVDMGGIRASRFFERDLEVAACEYVAEDGAFWRLWMATKNEVLVFLTYNCPAEDRDLERGAVDAMVATLDVP